MTIQKRHSNSSDFIAKINTIACEHQCQRYGQSDNVINGKWGCKIIFEELSDRLKPYKPFFVSIAAKDEHGDMQIKIFSNLIINHVPIVVYEDCYCSVGSIGKWETFTTNNQNIYASAACFNEGTTALKASIINTF